MDKTILNLSIGAISNCDMLIIGEASLIVYPAANLVKYFRSKNLVLIDKSTISIDKNCDLVINNSIGYVLSQVI